MVCKKCGCDTLINDGDWLKCPRCGTSFFNLDTEMSATKAIDMLESEEEENKTPSAAPRAEKQKKAKEEKEEKKVQKTEKKKEKRAAKEKKAAEKKTPAQNTAGSEEMTAPTDETAAPAGGEDTKAAEDTTAALENTKDKKKEQSWLKGFVEFMIPIVTAALLALILKTCIFANAIVPSGSMRSTIEAGDRIIASRISYVTDDPERYDIIIFKYPDDETQAFVKRIIGLPGETITIVNGVVYYAGADGQLYRADSSFVTTETPTGDFGPYYIPYKGEVISVSGGYCYAENGTQVGTLEFLTMYCEQDEETGEYVVSENLYFCMGDNRNDSHDSRYWENTYVAEDKIIGKVLFRYYPNVESID